jgi:hypothetical protein
MMHLKARVGPGPQSRAAAAAAGPLLHKAKVRFSGAVQLMIFIDCLALLNVLMILKKWGRSDFVQIRAK